MKKKIALTCMALAVLCCLSGCKAKRCSCTTVRAGELPAHSFEPLGNHKSCSELNKEWMAADSSMDILNKTCVEE